MSDQTVQEIFSYLQSFDKRLDSVQGYLRERHSVVLSWEGEADRLNRRIDALQSRLAALESKLEQ